MPPLPQQGLEGIVVCGAAGVSPALMGKCVTNQISLVFLDRNGMFLATVEGEQSGNVLLRRKQYKTADDENKSLPFAKNFIVGKLFNSRWSLDRTVRDYPMRIDLANFGKKIDYLKSSVVNARNCTDIDSLRGIEGETAKVYYSVFDDMILQQKEDFTFNGRSKRPPLDRVNALLSFTYSVCTALCSSALASCGLDPFVGFMHTDRPGRRSLALDLVEELRAVLCDRFVLTLINKKIINKSHFLVKEDGAVLLNDDGRKVFFKAWQERKQEEFVHPFLNETINWGLLPYVQSLLLSRTLRGDLDEYPPFLWK